MSELTAQTQVLLCAHARSEQASDPTSDGFYRRTDKTLETAPHIRDAQKTSIVRSCHEAENADTLQDWASNCSNLDRDTDNHD